MGSVLVKRAGDFALRSVPYTSSYATAEWIDETPVVLDTSGNVFTVLPSLTRTAWDLGTTNGVNARLKSSEELQLVNSTGKVIGAPSAPDSDTDGLGNCAWATSCSAPPS
jgi:hypothetical protein